MTKVRVDAKRCIPCEVCQRVCPKNLFSFKDNKLTLSENFDEKCNSCMHCVAFCPLGAITHDKGKEVSNLPVFRATPEVAQSVLSLLLSRRSIRAYRQEVLSQDVIDKILDAVNNAPTGANRREIRWVVTQTLEATKTIRELMLNWWDKEGRKEDPAKIAFMFDRIAVGKDSVTGGAPHMAFCIVKQNANPKWESLDAGIALAYFNVAAEALNVGCMLSGNSVAPSVDPAVRQFLGLADDEKLLCGIAFGRMVFHPKRIPAMVPKEVSFIQK